MARTSGRLACSPIIFLVASILVLVLPASGATSSSSAHPSNPTAPSYDDDVTWLTAYLTIHSLSRNSYVYMYFLWFLVALVFLALSCATWSGVRGATALGARWAKWALRRRTWRKKHTLRRNEADARRRGVPVSAVHRQPRSLPSNAQILSAVLIIVVVFLCCFVGPDYINPDLDMFQFSSTKSSTVRRAIKITDSTMAAYIPHYTISKSYWTMGARTGGVAFALFPLVVVLALKAPPFALFAIPGLVAYSHDKMIRLHRYVGRLVWFVTLLHVVFWVVQVLKDKRPSTGELVFMYVWEYQKFRFAWVAFLSMTILMICTLDCIRNPHYEIFYFAHVVFTPMTIVFSALHHPQRGVWGWCAAALALWIGERLWRVCVWIYVNGVFSRLGTERKKTLGRRGSVTTYTYTRTGRKNAPSGGHSRMAPSRASVATLIDPSGGQSEVKKLQNEEREEWEMSVIRAPAPRRPQFGMMEMRRGSSSDDEGIRTRTSSRPPSSVLSASTTSLCLDPHEADPTPTPGELIELAYAQTVNCASARGVPLTIQTGDGIAAPQPTYPPLVHPREVLSASTTTSTTMAVPMQSPGAGPGPRTSARQASLSASAFAFNHQFKPHPSSSHSPQSRSYAPPPGYALATLLPGRTVRLHLVTPGYQTWAPGQHFLVCIPAISRFTTHPFSVASVCDEQAALRAELDPDEYDSADDGYADPEKNRGKKFVQAEAGRELVLLIRAKKGWTKRLWDLVSTLQSEGLTSPAGESLPASSSPPPSAGINGVVLRTLVDGPFGSAGRTRWGTYSSVLIVAGGSGVSFGLSVLEYVCLCIAGRDGRFLGGYPGGWGVGKKGDWVTQRVRFVWLVREYAHIQWCVGALRRCLTIVPTDALELNIFVTNFRPPKEIIPSAADGAALESLDGQLDGLVSADGLLKPPAPRFHNGGGGGGGGGRRNRRASVSSEESFASDTSVDSIVDSYFDGEGSPLGHGHDGGEQGHEHGFGVLGEGHEGHVLDYTNFDGDDDTPMPGEHRLSRKIIKESKLRRARTRRVKGAQRAKRELEERAAALGSTVGGHTKAAEEEEEYGNERGHRGSHRASTYSTAPLLPTANANANAISIISPTTSIYSSFSPLSPLSPLDRHNAHPRPRSRSPPPSSFNFLGLGDHTSGNGHNDFSSTPSHRHSVASSALTITPSHPSSNSNSNPAPTPSTSTPTLRCADASSPSASSPASPWDVNPKTGFVSGTGPGGFALEPQEVRDLQIVSEWARPGKPKLEKILADEVESSKGRVAVACCGPTSLNALMRKLIAEQINPARVARGDMRGSIDFIAEDFEY